MPKKKKIKKEQIKTGSLKSPITPFPKGGRRGIISEDNNLVSLDFKSFPDVFSAFLILLVIVASIYIAYSSFKPYYGSVEMKKGQGYIQAGKPEEALNFLNKSVSFDPYNGNIYFFLGMAYQKLNKFKESLEAYQNVKKYADTPHLHVNLGAIYYHTQNWKKAKEEYEEAIRIYPEYPVPYYNLALIYRNEGKYKEAKEMLKKLLYYKPDYDGASQLLADIDSKLGNATASVQQYQDAMKKEENAKDSNFNLGLMLMNGPDFAKAIPYFQKAIQEDPNHFKAMNNLGALYVKVGKTDEALFQFENALKVKPDYPEAMLNLGITIQRKNKFDTALTLFDKVLASNTSEVEKNKANLLSAYSLIRLGRLKEAEERLKKVPQDFQGVKELKQQIEVFKARPATGVMTTTSTYIIKGEEKK